MTYLNTSSGLSDFLGQISGLIDQRTQNNDQLRGLAAGGVIPASAAPGASLLSRLLGGPAQQQPIAPQPTAAPPTGLSGLQPPAAAPQAPVAPSPAPMQPVAPQSQPAGFSAAPAGPLPSFAAGGGNTARALAFYQAKGLSPVAASALVGGFQNESGSGLNTNALARGDGRDGSDAVGIGQWNGQRAQALHQFASANGLDPSNIDTQLQFSWAELNGPEKQTLAALQQANNPVAATAAALGYERPAGWSAENPAGAKTFGGRLKSTMALASSPFGGLDPNAFPQAGGGPLPTMTASGMGGQLSPATAFPRAASQPSSAMAFAPTAASAPAAAAINDAAPVYGSAPLNVNGKMLTRQQAENSDGTDHTDYDDAAVKAGLIKSANAAPVFVDQPASTAPASPSAAPVGAAAPTAPTAAPATASAPQGVTTPTLDQIKALIINPATRELGLKLWQSQLPKAAEAYTMSAGQERFDGQNHLVASVPAEDKTNDSYGVQVVGEDQYGNKQYGTVNKRTGAITPISGSSGAAAQKANPLNDPGVMNMHGQDFLNTLDQNTAAQVKAIVEGRAPYPTGMLLKTAYGQQLAAYVTQADPTFEAGNATARVKVRNEFMSGGASSPAGVITAGNTAIQHLGLLSDAGEALNNADSGVPGNDLYNSARNAVSVSRGRGQAIKNFNDIAGRYVEEATKFYRGAGGTEADIQRDLGNISPNMSPTELHNVLQTSAELLQSKINALQDRWRTGMGPMVDDFPVVHAESNTSLAKIAQRAGRSAPTTSTGPTFQPGAGVGAQQAQAPVRVSTPDDALKLPSGTPFLTPDGRIKVRP